MMYHHQLDAGAQPSAVLDSVVSFRLRDQFLALMMSGQQRCGLASPARTVCHGNPALVRQLWDFLSSSATTFFMGIVRASDRSEAEGMSSHCVRLRVSPLTLGIVGDDVTTSNCEYERGECVTHTVFYSKYLSLVNTVSGQETNVLGFRQMCYFSTNSKWVICLGLDTNWLETLYVANVTDLPADIPTILVSGKLSIMWLGISSSNPEEAVIVVLHESDAEHATFLILVLGLQQIFDTKQLTALRSTKVTTPKWEPGGMGGSLLCMKRDDGTHVFILIHILGCASGVGGVLSVEETTGSISRLTNVQTAELSQLDSRIFLVSTTTITSSTDAVQHVEFWDCNNTTKPLRVVDQNGVAQWIGRSGFFFKLLEFPTDYVGSVNVIDSNHKYCNKRKCITVEDASSGQVFVSLNFQPYVTSVKILRVFS